MSRTVKGVRYKKFKGKNNAPSKGRAGYVGRVHLMFYEKLNKRWRFVCGKRDLWDAPYGEEVDDDTPVTCVSCTKNAPDIVEAMEVVPDLDEFQVDQNAFDDASIDDAEINPEAI